MKLIILSQITYSLLADAYRFVGISQSFYASDILAFPSITPNEAFGLTLIEAMYCGCVPVTFTIPRSGVNWVSINNETGLEVENRNYRAIAQAIARLLKDEDLRDAFGKRARERTIRLFCHDIAEKQYQDLYMKIVKDARSSNKK